MRRSQGLTQERLTVLRQVPDPGYPDPTCRFTGHWKRLPFKAPRAASISLHR